MVASVCVIVPTIRNAVELGVALDGLSNQTHPEGGVLVVGPADDPGREVAESRGVRYLDDMGSRTRADACNVAIEATDLQLAHIIAILLHHMGDTLASFKRSGPI